MSRKNPDETIRDLERAASLGDERAKTKLAAAKARVGPQTFLERAVALIDKDEDHFNHPTVEVLGAPYAGQVAVHFSPHHMRYPDSSAARFQSAAEAAGLLTDFFANGSDTRITVFGLADPKRKAKPAREVGEFRIHRAPTGWVVMSGATPLATLKTQRQAIRFAVDLMGATE